MNASVRPVAAPTPALRSFEAQWQGRTADALAPWREKAMQRFLELGLPTMRDESWRYTSLRALQAQRYVAGGVRTPAGAPPDGAAWLTDAGRIPSILIVNGQPLIGAAAAGLEGLEIRSLRELAATHPERLSRYLGNLSDAEQRRWELLNTALFADGLYVRINQAVETPLCLVHVTSAAGAENAAYPRVIVDAAPGARATIIEHHLDAGSGASLCNSLTQVELGAAAHLEHYRVFAGSADATQIDSLDIVQDRDSSCRLFTMALGGGLVRSGLNSQLRESGAALDSYSLLVGHAARHVDCVAVVTHAAPGTRSRQTARSIASGTSRAIFNSKVIVAAGAVHADSQQSCRGMLLSANAEIDTRPQLEIHTDEVRCAHGATTGRLDPEKFFYLLSRGIDRDTAQSLLVFAFLDDVLTGMSLGSARTALETALIAQLPNAALLGAFR
ncbi:MAG: Fe-S cluster assembly protein SufD [Steroidobacterales bacterium]